MEDGLVLNIALDNTVFAANKGPTIKRGGRWTERLKAKRVSKRKEESVTGQTNGESEQHIDTRPSKRSRTVKDHPQDASRSYVPSSKNPSHVISSLFSSNPTVSVAPESSASLTTSKPSNAPVAASTFEDLGLSSLIVSHMSRRMSITQPTSIQRAALSALLKSAESRDAFIQSQTGSGKTLSFLLPVIQDLLPLSTLPSINRSIGTLAIILAPTRELAQQIYEVLENLLSMRLRPSLNDPDDSSPDTSSQRLTRWLVSGILTGGATRAHEKARLRKGIPILVSTPGRLLDHLQNTSAFDVGKCRWLILDEADRLLDLGFEESIQGILKSLDGRRKLALQAEREGIGSEVAGWDRKERRNILCSATLREDVQALAGVVLKHPIVIKTSEAISTLSPQKGMPISEKLSASYEKFSPPSQLAQKFMIVPLKLRLVALVALLRSLLINTAERGRQGNKIIVFLSCTDSVDFHWNLLGGATDEKEAQDSIDSDSEAEITEQDADSSPRKSRPERNKVQSTLLPNTSIYRLHGSLPLQTRLASLRDFSSKSAIEGSSPGLSSVLLCTSVASRGLDLPLVGAVIQHDLPTEGGATEYVHRVGRTARVGKGGEAWVIVGPSEEQWIPWIEERMGQSTDNQIIRLKQSSVESVLKSGFGGQRKEYEAKATQVQLSFERWVLRKSTHADLARKAYVSHMRAYATHPSDEKHIFHVRKLHLGHLAKAFALREAPHSVTRPIGGKHAQQKRRKRDGDSKTGRAQITHNHRNHGATGRDVEDAEQRMAAVVRSQGRSSKKGGVMVASGALDFQIVDADTLTSLGRR